MRNLLQLFVPALDLFEIHVHAVDPVIDEAAHDFSGGLKNTGNRDR